MPEQAKKAIVDAYVDSDDRVLDPTLLDKSVLERSLNQQVGGCWFCLTAAKTQARVESF